MATPSKDQPGQVKLLIFAASLRAGSLNRKLAALTAKLAQGAGAVVDFASLRDFEVPLYDGDLEASDGIPAGAQELKRRLTESDAFVIVSPEYNASMPGTIKNLIDWTSRLRPQPFFERHGLVMSASPSLVGGNRGLWALRVPLEHLGARIFPDMFSLSMAHQAFDGEDLRDAALRERLVKTVSAFLALAEAAKHYPCVKQAWIEFLGEPPANPADRVAAASARVLATLPAGKVASSQSKAHSS